MGPLGHAGRWITDATSRVVILHGFNMVAKSPPGYPSAYGFDDDDAAFLYDEGFNTVRIGVLHSMLEPRPGFIDDTYLNHIADAVATDARHGLFTLLDLHQDDWGPVFGGDGFAAWATQTDGLPNPPFGFAGDYLGNPALQRAFDHLWADSSVPAGGPRLQEDYAAALAHLAERFRGDPSVVGYDILNEPWPGSVWPACANPLGCPIFDEQYLTPFYARVIPAIHRADPTHIAWEEPHLLFDFGSASSLGAPPDQLTGLSFHDYCLAAGAGGAGPRVPALGMPCQVEEATVFANAASVSQRTGDALLNTEWGAGDLPTLARMAGEEDRNMMSWEQWTYFNCCFQKTGDSQSVILDPSRPPTPDNVRQDVLNILARPYPQAVAGTPLNYGFDTATRTFRLTYVTRAVGGELAPQADSRVFVGKRQYPSGYSVQVSGADVTSAPCATYLTLRNHPGAAQVAVTVARGVCGASANATQGAVTSSSATGLPGTGAAVSRVAHAAALLLGAGAAAVLRRRRASVVSPMPAAGVPSRNPPRPPSRTERTRRRPACRAEG